MEGKAPVSSILAMPMLLMKCLQTIHPCVTFHYFIIQLYIYIASCSLFNWLFLTAYVEIINHNSTQMVAWKQLIISNSLYVGAHINCVQVAVAVSVIDCFGGCYMKGSGSCCHQAPFSVLVFKTGNLLFTLRSLL